MARKFVLHTLRYLSELEELGMGETELLCDGSVHENGEYVVTTPFSVYRFVQGESPHVMKVFYRVKEQNEYDISMFEVFPGIFCTDIYMEIHGDAPKWETLKTIAIHVPDA